MADESIWIIDPATGDEYLTVLTVAEALIEQGWIRRDAPNRVAERFAGGLTIVTETIAEGLVLAGNASNTAYMINLGELGDEIGIAGEFVFEVSSASACNVTYQASVNGDTPEVVSDNVIATHAGGGTVLYKKELGAYRKIWVSITAGAAGATVTLAIKMAFGLPEYGEPVDNFPVNLVPKNLYIPNRTVAGWLEKLDSNYRNDWVGIAYNKVTNQIKRVGKLEGAPVGVNPGDAALGTVFDNIQRWTMSDSGQKLKPISKTDKRYHTDGTLVDLTGASGQIMTVFDEAYYLEQELGDWLVWGVSAYPMTDMGFKQAPPFVENSWFANGAYEASVYNSKLCSIAKSPVDGVSPVYPVTTRTGEWGHAGLTITAVEALGAARGTGWGNVHFWDVWWRTLLFRIRYASFNSQAMIGEGRTSLSGGTFVNGSYIARCGLGDTLSGHFGSVHNGGSAGYTTDVVLVDGIENAYGDVWEFLTGYLMSNYQVYYKNSSPYPIDSIATYTPITALDGSLVVLPATEGYLGTPRSGKAFMFDTAHNGSSASPVGDYCWSSQTGLRVALSGAVANDGSRAGVSALYSYDAPSVAAATLGGRLRFGKTRSA